MSNIVTQLEFWEYRRERDEARLRIINRRDELKSAETEEEQERLDKLNALDEWIIHLINQRQLWYCLSIVLIGIPMALYWFNCAEYPGYEEWRKIHPPTTSRSGAAASSMVSSKMRVMLAMAFTAHNAASLADSSTSGLLVLIAVMVQLLAMILAIAAVTGAPALSIPVYVLGVVAVVLVGVETHDWVFFTSFLANVIGTLSVV